jgi:putative transposon-encoded protein
VITKIGILFEGYVTKITNSASVVSHYGNKNIWHYQCFIL